EDPIDDPLLVAKQARAMLASLTARDAGGFAAAFESLLSGVPFNAHLPYEAYYQTIFLLALALAGQGVTAEGEAGDEKFDAHLRTATGDDFIVEIKYGRMRDLGPFPEDADGKNERIKEGLESLAAKAMAQIEAKKYSKKFQGAGSRIWKTALVISERTDVMIFFEEARNWILVESDDGQYEVKET
ncbi:MAG: PD-(D/E)XK nuclease domain-containing protein, partial [Deltaproteobacteria bacterium]|nr:PD-(D/E)XK nuclease domain-containing protein [Deltaproteobacteria bacterium]